MDGIIGNRTISALEQMAAFTEARQKVIADNIANVDTPGYQHKKVDLDGFQQAMAEAMQGRSSQQDLGPVTSDQVQRNDAGQMVLQPDVEPADNIAFHDGTNGQIEKDMTEMARNLLMHQVSVDMVRHHYRMIETAIRGRAT